MRFKFRLEMDVVLDAEAQARVIESARQLCIRDARVAAIDQQERPAMVQAEEVIDGPEDALMELVERNPLLLEAIAQIERLSCGPVEATPDPLTPIASNPVDAIEQGQADDSLDVLESGLYLCRWPNGDVSIVKADSKREAVVQLDEWAGAEPAWLVPLETCMIDFRLNDDGRIELTEFGEETAEFIWDRCYPELDQVLSSVNVLDGKRRGSARCVYTRIRTAVEHERKRLWRDQREGTPAKTALGRKLQKRLGTVGAVADHYVEVAAEQILRGKAGERGRPN